MNNSNQDKNENGSKNENENENDDIGLGINIPSILLMMKAETGLNQFLQSLFTQLFPTPLNQNKNIKTFK